MRSQSSIGQRTQELDKLVSETERKNLNEVGSKVRKALTKKLLRTQLKREQASYL